MGVIRHESACCATCHVYYEPGYEGPCQEPGCGGTVSYDVAIEAIRQRFRGAVAALGTAYDYICHDKSDERWWRVVPRGGRQSVWLQQEPDSAMLSAAWAGATVEGPFVPEQQLHAAAVVIEQALWAAGVSIPPPSGGRRGS